MATKKLNSKKLNQIKDTFPEDSVKPSEVVQSNNNNTVKSSRKHFLNLIKEHNKINTQSKIKGYSTKKKSELELLCKDLLQ